MTDGKGEPRDDGDPRQDAERLRAAVWTAHWASGSLHSCVGSGQDDLGEGFQSFWRPLFLALAPAARVLEVGTGNGVLPWSALQWRQPFDLRIDAVDLAAIAPAWHARLAPELRERVRLRGGVRMEALPFDAGCFDLVAGQFALEYGDRSACIAELRRVARPGARLALVCHHAEGLPVRLAQDELRHLDALRDPVDGLLAATRRVLPWFALAQTEAGRATLARHTQARTDRDAFNRAQDRLSVQADASQCPDVILDARAAVNQCLQLAAQGRLEPALAQLQALDGALEGAELRLRELCKAALQPADAAALRAGLQLGETEGWKPLRDRGQVLAWCLEGRWPE